MQGEMPFFDSPEDALKSVIQQLGGAKRVGQLIWPDKSVDAASRTLLDCLNSSRSEKLELTQIIQIFSLAKEQGYHAAFEWFSNQAGYDSHPITKAEKVDRLTSVIENSTKELSTALAHLERIQRNEKVKAA